MPTTVRGHGRPGAHVTSLLDLQRVIGNQAVQRMLEADQEMPAAPDAMTRFSVTHRYTLPAVVRRAVHDGVGKDNERPETEPGKGGGVRFSTLPGIDVPAQYDAIHTTLTYDPSITLVAAPATPTKFGQTDTRIEVNKSSGQPDAADFLVELVVENVITYWVSGGARKNVASDSDPNITQANYPTVVSDLTPSPTAVKAGGVDLLKNQPPRTQFWAEDLTTVHELFHADENEKFGRAGAIEARDWLNKQTARNLDQVEALVGRIPAMIAGRLATAMAPPAVEQRAYDDGAPAYTSRAQAIKAKGDAKGYVPPASP